MKIDCIKTALADGIGIASIAFGCTHRKHTCQGEFPKTPKEKINQGRMMLIHGEENRKNQVLADR